MLYPKQHLHEDLQVFTFNQIVGYMETAIEKGTFLLNNSLMINSFQDLIPSICLRGFSHNNIIIGSFP